MSPLDMLDQLRRSWTVTIEKGDVTGRDTCAVVVLDAPVASYRYERPTLATAIAAAWAGEPERPICEADPENANRCRCPQHEG